MQDDPRFVALSLGWNPVLVWFQAAKPRCPCKTIGATMVSEWQTFAEAAKRGDYSARGDDFARHALSEQLAALRDSIAVIQRYSGDDRSDFGPLKEAIQEMKRHGYENKRKPVAFTVDACPVDNPNCHRLADVRLGGGDFVQPLSEDERGRLWGQLRIQGTGPNDAPDPATRPKRIDPRRDFDWWRSVCDIIGESRANALHEGGWSFYSTPPANDPHLGGPVDALFSALGEAGQEAARGTIAAAGEAARGQIPGMAAAVRTEVPSVVQAAGEAARPVARDVAADAGEAAGRGAAGGAASGAKAGAKSAAPVVFGLLAAVGIAVGIGYAASNHKGRKGT
jgi:hypothetical protein